MSAIKGPNIIKNGLVLALDAANVQSFKGEPTTNIAASGGLVGMSGITLTDLGLEDGWRKYSMSGTFTGGTYPYIMHISGYTFTGGVLYTSKCIVKTNVGFKFNYFGANGLSYVNEPMNNGGTLSSTQNSDGSYTIARIGFAYTNTTNQPGYLWTNPINNTSFNSSTDFVYIKELQVEQKAYATPFVNGTRGTTVATGGGWADQSGGNRHGELVNGPIFGADNFGSIVFDGSNDYISIQHALISGSDSFTVNQWIQSDASEIGGTTFGNYPAGNLQIFYGSLYVGMWLNNSSTYVDSPIPFLTTPVMITATRSNTTTAFYQNGVLLKTGSSSASIGTSNFRIGTNTATTEQYTGKVFVTHVYNRALTATEILQNYNATRRRFGL
jgi:hypothetical protein